MTRKNLSSAEKWKCLVHRKTLIQCAATGDFVPATDIEFDHTHQQATGGEHKVDNFRPIQRTAHKKKTAQDAKDRAKANRLAKAKAAHEAGEKKASRMKSRGFDKRFTKGFDGRVRPKTPATAET